MTAIRVHRHIDSETLHLPELKAFLGQDVDILVTTKGAKPSATEKDWEDFFANEGPLPIDADLCRQYREFDRQQNTPSDL